ncbi:tetratricopeptide repeat protein [Fodinibius salsisoli]|uniref:Tetratricopeptide repeat protein n=1 Tax=Fodinibius salsisoli TaxID=2820877 RepID=A0ABT3PSW5_9BACT|nr:tetratricopeptide repeat protein [Fodinibius salsisoli]MCW9708964.1 tetratricopeptide repeat protein [Fodinibius salsisoli]
MKRLTGSIFFLISTFLVLLPGDLFAQDLNNPEFALGKVQFEVSCSEEVISPFNKAVALLHHMTYPLAKEAFEKVAAMDPNCAIAHWGIGMTLFQPLWPTRPGPEELKEGWESVRKAKSLNPPTRREQLFIETTEAFYRDPMDSNYWERIGRWAEATKKLYDQFPDDPEVKAFFSLSLLSAGQLQRDRLDYNNRAAEIALSIHAENQFHPGAIHYLIHANDIRGREQESLDVVESYGAIAPRNPHALHMPTHIFTRLGHWDKVIEGNRQAAEAALEHPAGDKGQFIWDEYPHAVEYMVYAYLQQGDDEAASALLTNMQSKESLHPTFKTAFHLSSAPARYALERRAWLEAAGLIPRAYNALAWDDFPWPEAITWFARGLGAVHNNDLEESKRAVSRIRELEKIAHQAGEDLFRKQIKILQLGLSAWLAHAENKEALAESLMRQMADLETSTAKHPVTPAPTLPALELLGDLLMEQGKHEEALAAYRETLALYPRRFNSLLGVARAARALENQQIAAEFYSALIKIGADGSNRSGLDEAQNYLQSGIKNK